MLTLGPQQQHLPVSPGCCQPRPAEHRSLVLRHAKAGSRRKSRGRRQGSEYLYGVYPVLAALTARKRRFKQLWLGKAKPGQDEVVQRIKELASELVAANDLEVRIPAEDRELKKMSKSQEHEGAVLVAGSLPWADLEAMPEPRQGALWIVADGITDHMNLSKVIQAAAFFEADGMIVSSRGSCGIGVLESVASAGHAEVFPFFRSPELPRVLAQAQEAGWSVLGTGPLKDGDGVAAWSCDELPERLTALCDEKQRASSSVVLVLGGEGSGLPPELRSVCDALIEIPGHNAAGVDSLNLGVASGILLHALRYALTEKCQPS